MGKKGLMGRTGEATPHFSTNHSCKITIILKFYRVRIHPAISAAFFLTYSTEQSPSRETNRFSAS